VYSYAEMTLVAEWSCAQSPCNLNIFDDDKIVSFRLETLRNISQESKWIKLYNIIWTFSKDFNKWISYQYKLYYTRTIHSSFKQHPYIHRLNLLSWYIVWTLHQSYLISGYPITYHFQSSTNQTLFLVKHHSHNHSGYPYIIFGHLHQFPSSI